MRFNNLTFARFIAALLVFLHHSTASEYAALAESPTLRAFFQNGHVGVSFFFIVSGFVIAASSLERLKRPSPRAIASFYWNRFARIVPLWALVSAPLIWQAHTLGLPGLKEYLTFTQAWSTNLGITFGLLAVSWTLAVEAFFYLIFPVIALLAGACRRVVSATVLITLGLVGVTAGALYFHFSPELAALASDSPLSPHYWLYRFPPVRAFEFLIGIGLYALIDSGKVALNRYATLGLLLAAATALVVAMCKMPYGGAWWTMPYAPIFAVLVYAMARLDQVGMSITSPTALLLGEASFAFYLVHQYYGKVLLFPQLEAVAGVRVAQAMVLVLMISLSVGLFTLVEAPARKALVNLFRWVTQTLPASIFGGQPANATR